VSDKPMLFDPKTPYVWSPKYRRRRKHTGDGILDEVESSIDELEEAKRRGRIWCSGCRKFKAWANVGITYDIRNGRVQAIVNKCDDCGTVVKTREV
jgi:hypothetical protein